MVEIDPLIVAGYITAIVVLIIGLIYGIYKAIRGG